MADQQITIDYTVAPVGKQQPQIDVHLVLTYKSEQTTFEGRKGAFEVTTASGTYTTTTGGTSTVHEIAGLLTKHHLGNNNNLIYPAGDTIVDQHGITFDYVDPLKGKSKYAVNHKKQVDLFYNPTAGHRTLQQYSSARSRDVASYVVTGGAVPSAVKAASVSAAVAPDCFTSGTLIRTIRGDVAVEELNVGDLAITATGEARPIKWLGHRDLDLRGRSAEAMPVRVAANAFGPEMPARDLTLSPGHPVLVGADSDGEHGHLVPIMCLVNGTTIERVAMASVSYWHVELDSHDILLAEGLPAESYIAYGDRTFFTREADDPLANPDLMLPGLGGRCRPVAVDGPVVERERDRLDTLFATRLGDACSWPDVDAALEF